MLPDALEATIEQATSEGKRPKMLYLIPTFQNPQAWTMPIERRREIVDVAARKSVPVLEDDGVAEFRFEGSTSQQSRHWMTPGWSFIRAHSAR